MSEAARLTVGVGFEDVSDGDLDSLADRLDAVGAGGVTIAVGRPDWVAFEWPEHPETEATSSDRVRRAVDVLGQGPKGQQREVTLVIDVLAPRLIEEHPDEAAVGANGKESGLFASPAALRDGVIGSRIVELCGVTAERYRPDRIALTELILDQSFSDADKRVYRQITGRPDWPRDHKGRIDTEHRSLATFRSEVAADLVERCATAAEKHGVRTDVDVRAAWQDPTGNRAESGHDYRLLLTRADHLTVWNYFALNDAEPAVSEDLTAGLRTSLGDRIGQVTMSVGLWADGDGDAATEDDKENAVLPPAAMAEGVRASLTNGVTTVSVTPASRMTEEHWAALAGLGFQP
ncbi:MAG: hypothetical protein Q4G46_10860 [Propionibacteriaceae bacterium]|nr:hypothetical protein [Propionibacteriaceae bacterium]